MTINTYFDILITIGLVATLLPASFLYYHLRFGTQSWEKQHPKLTITGIVFLLIGALTLLWGSFVEPRLLVTKQQTINLPNITEPISIAFIADFQIGAFNDEKLVQKTVDRIIEQQPDIVLIGGDNVDNEILGINQTQYLAPLATLTEHFPVFTVHGNHEYGVGGLRSTPEKKSKLVYTGDVSAHAKAAVEALGITYLENELLNISIRDQAFYLFGGDSLLAGNLDLSILEERDEEIPTIALIHNPSAIFELEGQDVDLLLSGHTHGGQIRLPYIGPLGLTEDHRIPNDWYQGYHETDFTKLYVTSGVGETGTRARLFNPPEIVMLTIK